MLRCFFNDKGYLWRRATKWKQCFLWNYRWVWPSWKTGCCGLHTDKTIKSHYIIILYYNSSSICLFEEGLSCWEVSVKPGIFEMENIKERPRGGRKNSYKKFAERELVKGVCLHSHIVFISSAQPALVDCVWVCVCVNHESFSQGWDLEGASDSKMKPLDLTRCGQRTFHSQYPAQFTFLYNKLPVRR